jgi:uncharacterized protein with von Willebrand factor type A (vWA) domain
VRGAGLDVPLGSVVDFVEAVGAVGLARREGVYWAARATMLRRPEDRDAFDRAFAAFWEGLAPPEQLAEEIETITLALEDETGDDDAARDDESGAPTGPVIAVRYSPREVLRDKDFAAYTHAEFDEARRLMADLKLTGSLRRTRRRRPARRGRGAPDLRRTVRRAFRSGGEPLQRAWLEPADRPRRIVLLCDVSGSMEPYTRGLLRFLHAAVAGRGRVEAFAIGTRLTRLTRELSSRDPDAALERAARAVRDWSGGTRLGEGIRRFNDDWGVRGMARGAIVVVLSDGWDRGDPAVLAQEMARLHRVAHRVVWVNPLKATEGYTPVARGMAAALPYVDRFVEGHSLAALEQLAGVIADRT